MNPDKFTSSRESKLKQLQVKLEAIFAFGGSILGHGTPTVQLAENMLRVGLVSSYSRNVSSSAVPIDSSIAGINQVLNWKHKDHKYIVIISIPASYQRSMGEMSWGERLFEDITEQDDEKSTIESFKPSHFKKSSNAKLPPRYIVGYVDVKELKFVENPNFEQDPKIPDYTIPYQGSHLDFIKKREEIHPVEEEPKEKPDKTRKDLPDDPDIW